MFGIGTPEILIFAIIAMLVFLPKALPAQRELWASRFRKCGPPRFALKDLLASTALIALGLSWIAVALPNFNRSLDRLELPVWQFVMGSVFIGAGILNLFKRL